MLPLLGGGRENIFHGLGGTPRRRERARVPVMSLFIHTTVRLLLVLAATMMFFVSWHAIFRRNLRPSWLGSRGPRGGQVIVQSVAPSGSDSDVSQWSRLHAFLEHYFSHTEPPAASEEFWLTIVIPSRPRPDKEKHKKLLQDVLKSFLDEDHMKQQAIVLVVNNSPMYGSHSALDEWTGQKRRGFAHVHVVDNPYLHAILDLAPAWGQNSSVSSRSKHHLLDVIGTLMVAYRRIPASSLYMFHEDDFVSCPGALQAIWRGINDANHYFCACTSHKTLQSHHTGLKAWRGIRFTHGMAGIVVPAAAIPSIALYMLQSAERVPVDHALVEWILGAGEAPWQSDLCPYFVVKENWFEHMGQSLSTFHGRRHVQGLRCGDQMTPIGIFRKGEAFDEKACATDRIYPCAASIQQERKEHSDLYDDVPPLESVLTLQQTRADALVERQLGKESMEVFLETEGIEDWTQERRLLLEKLEAQKALVRALEKESGTWKVLKDISKNRLRPDPPANRVKAWRESERPLWDAAHPPILPLPRTWTNGSVLISVSSSLAFSLPHPPREAEADVLLQAFARYKSIIFQQSGASESHGAEVCILKFIDVSVRDYSHTLDLETDESYELFIPETSNNDHCNKGGLRGSVQAKTQVGALRALETFSQLVFFDPDRNQYMIKSAPWSIVDAPRFQHREVLLDTSRHFFPLVRIKSLISAMSMAKFNVFHWHITDDQSFPLEVPGYPLLSRGAFSSMERYSAEDVKSVVGWGRLHGVRVVPEVDMPGHTRSWCKGYPDICPSSELACQMPLSPICPSVHTPEASNTTYQVVGAIITELSELFSDAWLHIGVDEVSTECWESSELVRKWMSLNNLNQSSALQQFLDVTASMVRSLGKTPVMWADAFMQAYLPKDVILQIWRYDASVWKRIISAGHRVIMSHEYSFYLDYRQKSWEHVWRRDPCAELSKDECKSVLGAGVSVWSESVDPSNVDQILWPRAAGAAEGLWSGRGDRHEGGPIFHDDLPEAAKRLEALARVPFRTRLHRFRCLLLARGIGAEPTNKETGEADNWGSLAPKFPQSCFTD